MGLALVACMGCDFAADVFGTAKPPATPIASDSTYLRYWKEVEACSGERGRMGRVNWYAAPDGTLGTNDAGIPAVGHWYWPHDIVLAESRTRDANTVRHEILHDLLGAGHGHPAVFQRCRHLVEVH